MEWMDHSSWVNVRSSHCEPSEWSAAGPFSTIDSKLCFFLLRFRCRYFVIQSMNDTHSHSVRPITKIIMKNNYSREVGTRLVFAVVRTYPFSECIPCVIFSNKAHLIFVPAEFLLFFAALSGPRINMTQIDKLITFSEQLHGAKNDNNFPVLIKSPFISP